MRHGLIKALSLLQLNMFSKRSDNFQVVAFLIAYVDVGVSNQLYRDPRRWLDRVGGPMRNLCLIYIVGVYVNQDVTAWPRSPGA